MLAKGVVPLQGLEDGLYAYAAAARYHEHRAAADTVTVPRSAMPAPDGGAVALDEWASKARLTAL